MYLLGLDRSNFLRYAPTYIVLLANLKTGSIIFKHAHLPRANLQRLVNLPQIDELAVWSDDEFNLISNLCSRNILIVRDLLIKRNNVKEDPDNLSPYYFLNRIRRFRNPDLKIPPLELLTDEEDQHNLALTVMKFDLDCLVKIKI